MMETTVATSNCTNARKHSLCPKFTESFKILGKKWNGLILEVLLNNGASRFKDIAQTIIKCSDRVLVERLKELEQEGLINRVTHENSSLIEYVLTDKGEALAPVLQAAHAWGDDWISDEECED